LRKRSAFHLFEGLGIELEYMIVDSESLDVLPISDEVLHAAAGKYVNDYSAGLISWSNELVLHTIELKNNSPVSSLNGLAPIFQEHITHINRILKPKGGRLMPSAMHPWMDPASETKLWPHRNRRIYEAYDRIFNCRAHGWSNLQSIHINLPFRGDEEFRRLHAAVRLLLPIMPALAASSPVVEGRITNFMDNRLFFYRGNQRKIPSITGKVIPEAVYTRTEYENLILKRMFKDIADHDPKGILHHEWLNSRGAIPRFDRSTIEIRILDIQECPLADIAIAVLIVAVLKSLITERWSVQKDQGAQNIDPLVSILEETMSLGEAAVIKDARYLKVFSIEKSRATASEMWKYLVREIFLTDYFIDAELKKAIQVILDQGPLSRRILKSTGKNPSRERLRTTYKKLCDCLEKGEMFLE
jgi:carboxylate-amine ligase